MKYCNNCGKKLINGSNYCDNCGYKVLEEQKEDRVIRNDGNWKYYVLANIIIIALNIFSSRIGYSNFGVTGFIVALVIIITAKVKYPKVTIVSVLFWIEIIIVFLIITYIIFLMAMCVSLINSCG